MLYKAEMKGFFSEIALLCSFQNTKRLSKTKSRLKKTNKVTTPELPVKFAQLQIKFTVKKLHEDA